MDRQLGSKPHWRGSSFTVLPSTPIRQPGGTVRVAVAAVFGLAHEPHQKVLPRPRAGRKRPRKPLVRNQPRLQKLLTTDVAHRLHDRTIGVRPEDECKVIREVQRQEDGK